MSIPEILLLGPGPTNPTLGVLAALAQPTLGHLDPVFLDLADRLGGKLASLMGAGGGRTLVVSGTGSAGMEAAAMNLLEPGDRVLVLVNGVFGGRRAEVSRRVGAEVETMEFGWGKPVEVESVGQKVADREYKMVGIVHAETSTGVRNPVAEVGALLRQHPALYWVDCVTSLGGMPFLRDEWGIDVAYSGTQKCLSCPPGLSPLSLSERALGVIRGRSRPCPSWYLDVGMLLSYYTGSKRIYHHTAPINMIYALDAALEEILMEGLSAVHDRHRAAHEALVFGLGELGLEMLVEEGWRLPMLNTVVVPPGVDEAKVRLRLREEFLIEIGSGLGPMAGKIWRVGLMGRNASPAVADRFLTALRKCL